MKILWVSHFVPYPPIGGCFQRSYNLLHRLGATHEVHVVAVRHKSSVHKHVTADAARSELMRDCRSVDIVDLSARTTPAALVAGAACNLAGRRPMSVTLYESAELRDAVSRALGRTPFDVVHLDTISLVPYADAVPDGVPIVLNHHNVESDMMRRRVAYERNPAARWFYALEARKLRRYEGQMCGRFQANVVVSPLDGERLRQIAPGISTAVVENGVDVEFFSPAAPAASRKIVFAGRLDQYANRDGILHFMREVWPLVTKSVEGVELTIIGANAPQELLTIGRQYANVRFTGFVDDVRPHFHQASAVIVPLRDGGGTRLKVLDALGLGMPIVSTSLGIEGIDLTPERDVLVADAPDAFAAALHRVLTDETLRRSLATNARRRAEETYSWERIAARLDGVYRGVVSGRGAAA